MKPLDEFVERLSAEIRVDPSGARSLAHILVVVPTAQSGRRLRFALAERFSALVPPEVQLPPNLFGEWPSAVASRTDEILAFQEALGPTATLEEAAQFSDIRRLLGANALLFSDVADKIDGILSDEMADIEIDRWRGLAELEKRYFAALEKGGKEDRVRVMKRVIAEPSPLVGIEKVFLACLLDPLPAFRQLLHVLQARDRLDVEEWVPSSLTETAAAFSPTQVIPCATAASEAEHVAEIFADVKPSEALPALCVADAESFPELKGALQAKGIAVQDPAQAAVTSSSLGHLVEQVATLMRTRSYSVFSAFIRSGDARRWLCTELNLTEEMFVAALIDLDNRQAKLLPETLDDILPKTGGKLRAIFETVDALLRKKSVRQVLQTVFAGYLLDERDPAAREFAAAAEVINALIDECFPASASGSTPLTLSARLALFSLRLRESTYSLEPDASDTVLTEGWLEIPFVDADELIVTGFNEGRVPESVVGHAFLPDRLRRGLGLPDNESRLARDRKILRLALACRAPSAVTFFFRALDAKGDVLKPSRLLFDGLDDSAFVQRVTAFYRVRAGTEALHPADLPPAWRLKLEIPPALAPLDFTSPSSLDLYLRCPFTYYLKKTFGERQDDRAEELDPSEFGHLVHDALERWGCGNLRDSEEASVLAAELAGHVDALLGERFGTAIPAIVALQGESAKRRLAAFARIQATWHQAGWRIMATERKLKVVYHQTTVKGRCDRIDRNEKTGEWCVLDYKTYDHPDRARAFDPKKHEWKSLQLPLYCAMLDADPAFPEATRERISSAYCLLGKTAETTCFTEPLNGALVPEAEAKVRELIGRIEQGIFWPPSPQNEWQWDFKAWIFNTPEESVDLAWLADQRRRTGACAT